MATVHRIYCFLVAVVLQMATVDAFWILYRSNERGNKNNTHRQNYDTCHHQRNRNNKGSRIITIIATKRNDDWIVRSLFYDYWTLQL